jgi:hypothetical protein
MANHVELDLIPRDEIVIDSPDSAPVELDLTHRDVAIDSTGTEPVELDLIHVDEIVIDSTETESVELDLIAAEAISIEYLDGEVTLEVVGEVGPRGIQGIQGEVGPPGPPPVFYRHHQTSASAQWLVDHNLSYPPAITVVDSAGTVLIADVVYIDDFHVQIDFSAPTAGYAYCT